MFEEEEDPSQKSFFSEIISSISDVKFSKDGNYILSRDYLTLKIWDVRNEAAPVKKINIHDHLRGKLCDLYENDCIFDKFECTFSGDGKWVWRGPVIGVPLTAPPRNSQASPYRLVPQLFPDIRHRRRRRQQHGAAGRQVGLQGQEDWRGQGRCQGGRSRAGQEGGNADREH